MNKEYIFKFYLKVGKKKYSKSCCFYHMYGNLWGPMHQAIVLHVEYFSPNQDGR